MTTTIQAPPPMDYQSGEAREALRQSLSGTVRLAHAGDRPAEGQYNGRFYQIAPGERLQIRDQMDLQRGKNGKPLRNLPKHVVVAAVDLAAELVAMTRMGKEGVYIEFGDGYDDVRRETARKTYISWRREGAMRVQANVIAKAEVALKIPGGIPKAPTAREMEEIEWLNRYNRGLVDRKRWISLIDGFESDDRNTVAAHLEGNGTLMAKVRERGGIDAAIMDRDATTEQVTAAVRTAPHAPKVEAPVAPAAPEAPIVVPEAAGSVFVRAAHVEAIARRYGVNLTKSELLGLLRGDEAIVSAVADKVADAGLSAKGAAAPVEG